MVHKQLIKSILVPVDFSKHSEAALLLAAELAELMGVSITVLHVIHDPGEAPGYYTIKGRKKQLRRMEDVAAVMLKDFVNNARDNNKELTVLNNLETILVAGLPVNRILELANNSNYQMIFMGSQGRTGLAHMMLGSKAEQVVRLSPIPVTIVKAEKSK